MSGKEKYYEKEEEVEGCGKEKEYYENEEDIEKPGKEKEVLQKRRGS